MRHSEKCPPRQSDRLSWSSRQQFEAVTRFVAEYLVSRRDLSRAVKEPMFEVVLRVVASRACSVYFTVQFLIIVRESQMLAASYARKVDLVTSIVYQLVTLV